MTAFLRESDAVVEDVCYTAALRRNRFQHRLAVVGRNAATLGAALEMFERGEPSPDVVAARAEERPKLAFVFSGMGRQFAGMACGLLRAERVFRDVIDRCDGALAPLSGWSLRDALVDATLAKREGEAAVAQVTNYAVQAGLAALLRSWGIVPDAVAGHSVGEVAAAHAAGVLTLETASRVSRGRLVSVRAAKAAC